LKFKYPKGPDEPEKRPPSPTGDFSTPKTCGFTKPTASQTTFASPTTPTRRFKFDPYVYKRTRDQIRKVFNAITIRRANIVDQQRVPARIIVNPANPQLEEAAGINATIFNACGKEKHRLVDSCQRKLPLQRGGYIPVGKAVRTPAFGDLLYSEITTG
jgi:hypothetical protein